MDSEALEEEKGCRRFYKGLHSLVVDSFLSLTTSLPIASSLSSTYLSVFYHFHFYGLISALSQHVLCREKDPHPLTSVNKRSASVSCLTGDLGDCIPYAVFKGASRTKIRK